MFTDSKQLKLLKQAYGSRYLHLVIVVLSLCFSSVGNAKSSQASSNLESQQLVANLTTSRYQDGEELLFSLILDKHVLGEVSVLVERNQFYIHFEDLILSADFVINRSSPANIREYNGWWSNENNTFTLRFSSEAELLADGESNAIAFVTRQETKEIVTESELIEFASEIYVRADILAKWFGANFSFDESKLLLNTVTTQAWPFQLSQQRKKSNLNNFRTIPDAVEPHYDPGFAMLSPQTIDFIASARASRIESENRRTNVNYSLLGRQDILGLSTKYFVSGNQDDAFSQGTIDFSRFWPNEEKGPLGITSLQFGDIQPARVGNTSTSATRGIRVSNRDLNRRTNQEVTNISGLVQSGWDVELYQNKVLIKQLFDVQNGRYEFLDITLYNGLNEFEVIKYGPQGQIEKETFERLLDSSLSELSNASYEISLTQNNKDMLGIQNLNSTLPDNFLFSGNYSYSFNNNHSINFAHSNQLGHSLLNDQYRLGLVSRVTDSTILNSSYTYIPNQLHGTSFSLRSSLGQQLVSASLNIEKHEMNDVDPLKNKYSGNAQFSMAGNLFKSKTQSLHQQSELVMARNLLGDDSIRFSNRLAYRTKWFGLNHLIDFTKLESSDGLVEESTFGILNTNFNIGKVNARAGASYQISDDSSWETLFVNANWYFLDSMSVRSEFSRNLKLQNNSYALGLDWKTPLYGINARIEHSDLFDTSMVLSARISFSEAPTEFGYIQSNRSLAEYGTVLVRIYHDVNNNRIYDAEDRPIKDAKVSAIQSRRIAKTDVIGIAQLDGLSSFRKTDIVLDKTSLDNPFLVHSTYSTSLTPRAGLITVVNYPLVEAGEVEGEVSFVDDFDRIRYLGNVPLIIKDSFGNQVANLKTGLDGYFYYTGLLPHTYYLSVDENYLNSQNFKVASPVAVKISEQGQQVFGANIILEKKPKLDGFVVISGEFTSTKMLEMYNELLKKRISNHPQLIKITPFVYELGPQSMALGLLFTDSKQEADQFCKQIQSITSSCSIKDHTLIL